MTIYDIKYRVTNAPHFFDRATMRTFGQTLKSFSVQRCKDGNGKWRNVWYICAPMMDKRGACVGHTVRWFNADTNTLEHTVPSIPVTA